MLLNGSWLNVGSPIRNNLILIIMKINKYNHEETYNRRDLVIHNFDQWGWAIWISLTDNNTVEPGLSNWIEVCFLDNG